MIRRLQYFSRVAETGSFSAVAKEYSVGQPMISKAIQALEKELGVKLFNRSTRGLALTEEGETAYQHSLRLLENYEQLVATQQASSKARGIVRVAVPMTLGTLKIIPKLEQFLNEHPDILIDLKMSDTFTDLINDGIDIAVRVGDVDDNRLVVKPVGFLRRELVASKTYLKIHGTPKKPADLKFHSCIIGSSRHASRQWAFKKEGKKVVVGVSGKIIVDSMFGIREAVLANLGIANVGELIFSEPRLGQHVKAILTDYELDPHPMSLVFLPNKTMPLRIRVVVDFLSELLKD